MKSNQNHKINQRLDHITMKHAVVGIDVAKDKHAAQVTDFRGRALTSRHLAFSNTEEGFERLYGWIQDVQAKHGLSGLIIGMEPTGHYWFNLAHWLLQRGIEVVLVNPVTTHRNKENRDNSPSKNDPKDAIIIADLVSRGFFTDYKPQAETYGRIKTVMSEREYWVKLSVSLGNRIVRWIDLYFPEFRIAFPDWTVPRSLASLHAFPLPSDLHGQDVKTVIAGWRKHGMKRAGGKSGEQKAAQLVQEATHSIGQTIAPVEAREELNRLLKAYKEILDSLQAFEQKVEELLSLLPMAAVLRSIGLGSISIAVILGCAGDLSRYAHGRQLLRRAGLNLAECMSGKFKGQIKLSKRGDSMLRKYLYLAILGLVSQQEDFKRWHQENQKRGMTKMRSLFKLIGKLARIIIGLVQREESYLPDLQQAA